MSVHSTQVHEGHTLGLKPRANITRSPKQRYKEPHKTTYVLQNEKKTITCLKSNVILEWILIKIRKCNNKRLQHLTSGDQAGE